MGRSVGMMKCLKRGKAVDPDRIMNEVLMYRVDDWWR